MTNDQWLCVRVQFSGISVYNVVVLCLIGVPTAYMIKEQVDASYTLISLFTFFATTLTICLIFIPKVSVAHSIYRQSRYSNCFLSSAWNLRLSGRRRQSGRVLYIVRASPETHIINRHKGVIPAEKRCYKASNRMTSKVIISAPKGLIKIQFGHR
jgi:hypothetical protein